MQIAAVVTILTVSQRAGHARTSTTTDIYAYTLESSDKIAADKIDDMFSNNNLHINRKDDEIFLIIFL